MQWRGSGVKRDERDTVSVRLSKGGVIIQCGMKVNG